MKQNPHHSYWLDEALITGSKEPVQDGEIVIIGSGIAGVSTAYWLMHFGYRQLTILDFEPAKAASFRNCGHVLYGTVESMKALVALHGESLARDIWQFSIEICHELRDTVLRHNFDVDYRQDGYFVIAIDEVENQEIHDSIELLNRHGFQSEYRNRPELEKLGFKNVHGARYEAGSAQVHPTKLRNALLNKLIDQGIKYHSGVEVESLEETNGRVLVRSKTQSELKFDAAVIACNAYSPLLSDFYTSRRLVEPFRGQIMTSQPLKKPPQVKFPHSFDHGYEYALVTADQRLMLGGWRNHTDGGEIGTYDITPNSKVEQGLDEFAKRHYELAEPLSWEYSWAGIMAASKTGFPFIGPTDSPLIFTVGGFTGHGLSWAHGSAKLLAKIMAGEPIPALAKLFKPA